MSREPYLHELSEFSELVQIVSAEKGIVPQLIEKDYWIMHCLYGLTKQGFIFELKGGTSLSKGYGIINRFSEDIDIRIDPGSAPFDVATGKNQTKKEQHIQSRKNFYDWLATTISIEGITSIERDHDFDDKFFRSGGIRLVYPSLLENVSDLKEGILLEIGFDDTTPNESVTISSWAYDHAIGKNVTITDNRANDIKCYHPGYTFVEKLQTVSTKFRQQQATNTTPTNFLRHYYDLSQLLDHLLVKEFIGTKEYHARKKIRFRTGDNLNISENEAFLLSDPKVRKQFSETFLSTTSLYYAGQPTFEEILGRIQSTIENL